MNKFVKHIALFASTIIIAANSFAQTTFNIENAAVKDYMDNVSYSFSETSRITEYKQKHIESLEKIMDGQNRNIPSGWTMDSKNFIPGESYSYTEDGVTKQFTATGRVRFIDLNKTGNVRDFGGWNTIEGKTVRYGLLYRGSEIIEDAEDLQTLLAIGIKAELDLRKDYEAGNATASVLGESVDYRRINLDKYYEKFIGKEDKIAEYKSCFDYIISQLKQNNPVYLHCIWGCDRAGTLSYLLEGLLGLSYSDLIKEYELSSFSKLHTGDKDDRKKETLDALQDYILSLNGNNYPEKFYYFWHNVAGVSEEDINSFRSIMLKDGGTHVHDFCKKEICETAGSNGLYSYKCAVCGEAPDNNIIKNFQDGSNLYLSNNGTNYYVSSLTIQDKKPFKCTQKFTAKSLSYNRLFTRSWATICLPYDMEIPMGYECYALNNSGIKLNQEEPTLEFTSISPSADGKYYIRAYSGYIIRYKTNATGDPDLSDFDVTNAEIKTNGSQRNALIGVLERTVTFNQEFFNSNSDYSFFGLGNDGYIHPIGEGATCPPFRAYFRVKKSELPSNNARIRWITTENSEEANTIQDIESKTDNNIAYNLRGQIVDINSYKGIVIINNRKVVIK